MTWKYSNKTKLLRKFERTLSFVKSFYYYIFFNRLLFISKIFYSSFILKKLCYKKAL
jgi:hypothetical protein